MPGLAARLALVVALLAVACSAGADVAAAQPLRYRATLIGPGDRFTQALAISDGGSVVGYSQGDGSPHAFVWRNGRFRLLPDLEPGTYSLAEGVSDDGRLIVGAAKLGDTSHAVVWEAGVPRALSPQAWWNTASDANNRGLIVGRTGYQNPEEDLEYAHATLWTPDGQAHDLGTLPGDLYSRADAINEAGVIVGSSTSAIGVSTPVYWDADGAIHPLPTLVRPDIDDPANDASDINNQGDIVGSVSTKDGFHAALWRNGELIDLGSGAARSSTASSITDNGVISGNTLDPVSGYEAVLWPHVGAPPVTIGPLVTPVWEEITSVVANEAGQLAGNGVLRGELRALLLTPIPHNTVGRRIRNLRWRVTHLDASEQLRRRLAGPLNVTLRRLSHHRYTAACGSMHRFGERVRDAGQLTASERSRLRKAGQRIATRLGCGYR